MACKLNLRFILEVTNLLDSQIITVVDQRYDFSQGGTANPNGKGGLYFQPPRSVRLGVRYSF